MVEAEASDLPRAPALRWKGRRKEEGGRGPGRPAWNASRHHRARLEGGTAYGMRAALKLRFETYELRRINRAPRNEADPRGRRARAFEFPWRLSCVDRPTGGPAEIAVAEAYPVSGASTGRAVVRTDGHPERYAAPFPSIFAGK